MCLLSMCVLNLPVVQLSFIGSHFFSFLIKCLTLFFLIDQDQSVNQDSHYWVTNSKPLIEYKVLFPGLWVIFFFVLFCLCLFQIADKANSHHNRHHGLGQHRRGFSSSGVHWEKRDWIIPPIRAPENSRRAFPRYLARVSER